MIRTFLYVFAGAVLSVPAFGDIVVYSANFESGSLPSEFSGAGSVITSGTFPAAAGLGSFVFQNLSTGNPAAATNIVLTGLSSHSLVGLTFSFLAIDSWDGTGCMTTCPDFLNVNIDGTNVYQLSIRNVSSSTKTSETFTGSTGSTTLAFYDVSDHIASATRFDSVWTVTLSGISQSASALNISVFASGAGWQGSNDESIGLDNIVVSTNAIPEPSYGFLVSAMLAVMGFAAQRKRHGTLNR